MNRRMKLRGTQTINSLSNINIAHEMNSTFLRADSRASIFYYYDLFTDRPILILRVKQRVVHVPLTSGNHPNRQNVPCRCRKVCISDSPLDRRQPLDHRHPWRRNESKVGIFQRHILLQVRECKLGY